MTQQKFTCSSKTNPCPICDRVKDVDCRLSEDGGLVLCHSEVEGRVKGEQLGDYIWIGKSEDGNWGKWIVPSLEPRKNPDYRPEGKQFRFDYQNDAGDIVCSKVRIYQRQSNGSVKKKDWWEPKGVDSASLLPYRYLEAIAALKADPTLPLLIDESEMTADELWQRGIPAIAFGRSLKPARIKKLLAGYEARLIVCVDQDVPGLEKAAKYQRMFPMAATLRPYPESDFWLPEWLPASGGLDIRDWLLEGNLSKDQILEAVQRKDSAKESDGVDRKLQQPVETAEQGEDKRPSLARRYEAVKRVLGHRLRLNSLSKELELDGQPLELDELQLNLAVKHGLNIPDNQIGKITGAIGKENAYNPVVDYLERVARQHGNSTEILDDLASRYLGTNHPLHKTYLRKTLISAVARAFTPGCKVDTSLILQGKQGVGKSSFFKVLASEPWFDDSLGNVSDKDERLKLHKVWFANGQS
ncbi:MAG: hypothetical protein HC770_13175 [Pseudanabaena sp. CRU_2_10]|nr:hypothetical protein [Pseudanabaena sp. CRU_2_10]